MRAMSLRNVPEKVYSALKEMATKNRRSLQEQVKFLLEQEVELHQGSSISKALAWRDRLKGRRFSDTVESVQEERNR